MLRLDDIVWESEASGLPVHPNETLKKKAPKKNKQTKLRQRQNELIHLKTSKQAAVEQPVNSSSREEATKYNGTGASLKDLNPQDKERVALLIKELAKADEEKENIVHTLHDERQQFLSQVKDLENEKMILLNRQEFLAEEVKQCQTLLQYYQNLITMQQTSILTQEEQSKHQIESAIIKENQPSMQSPLPHCKNVSFNELEHGSSMSADELSSQIDRIRVSEFENTDSSFTEDQILHMNNRQYRSFLERKRLKLKQEQQRLRKLLEIKVKNSDLSDVEVSPVRDIIDKELERSIKEVSDIKNDILEKHSFESPRLKKRAEKSSPMPTTTSSSFYTPTRTIVTPARSYRTSTVNKNSFHTPTREHNLSQTNLPKTSDSKSRLTSTLKNSVSPMVLFDALDRDRSEIDRSILDTIPYENSIPAVTVPTRSSIHSNDAAVATDLLTCDDSQILQEIFFV